MQLRDHLDAAGVPTAGQSLIHLVAAASLRGLVVRGPMVDGEHAYVSVPEWLGPAPTPLERPEALARLAHRYLRGTLRPRTGIWPTGPASPSATPGSASGRWPTRWWTGRPVSPCCRPPRPGPLPPPRLLGAFDPLLHGWVSRELFVGDRPGVVTTNGIFRPVALAGGRVVATWTMPGGVVTIEPLAPLTRAVRRGLAEDAADVLRYLGLEPRPVAVG